MKTASDGTFHFFKFMLLIAIFCFLMNPIFAKENNELLADIEILASDASKAKSDLMESVSVRIEQNAAVISPLLLARLSDATATESQQAIYIWSLGLAKDANAADKIIAIANSTSSELVKGNCLNALAQIGGEKPAAFLMTSLEKTDDSEMRFNLLNLLAQMQYEPAIEKMDEVLKKDIDKYYWQSIFIFGKMGDKSIPYLLERVSVKDRNMRANAIHILGQWLIAPESANSMREQYWKEKDKKIKSLILSSLEKVTVDLNEIEKFSSEVASKEKNKELATFAQETLDNLNKMKQEVQLYKKNKTVSAEQFQAEYDKLYRSAGKDGDYEIIAKTSSYEDEAKLKKLRERILQRNSDESFYDYQKINNTIMYNRFLKD